MGAQSAKALLEQHTKRLYRKFTLNDQVEAVLPASSPVPWIGASKREDVFQKICLPLGEPHQVRFITKNGKPHNFLWQTDAQKLQEALRWGVVRTESITGKVISSLGRYRVIAHERITRGMISNTHTIKMALLDLYQDRFEALQMVESLVNSQSSIEEFKIVFDGYIEKLTQIHQQLEKRFSDCNISAVDASALEQMRRDIEKDISRAASYRRGLKENTLKANLRARGNSSVLEFVKQQMVYNLYELQGINQDLTYSNQRRFALTRGTLNDCIEDARRDIDDHRADPRNAVTPKHHGIYNIDPKAAISYDFAADHLSPERERQVLLGISFIEGWDKVEQDGVTLDLSVSNQSGSENLSVISATNWKSHRNFTTFLKKTWHFLFNTLKGVFVRTRPWEEEAWTNPDFHLVAKSLREHASPNEPLWYKPFHFIKQIFNIGRDIVLGFRNISAEFVFDMPFEVLNDWSATKSLPELSLLQRQIRQEINAIKSDEDDRLQQMLKNFPNSTWNEEDSPLRVALAQAEYHLTAGEANDLLNSIVRGLDGFFSLFTHEIFAKDPVAGLIFTSAYLVGAGAIFFPALSTSIFGAAYVHWFSKVSFAMGSSKLAAVIAGGSTQAQVAATIWDTLMHGPKSMLVGFADHVFEDPITVAAYFGAAYGIGYFLANGIPGHPIPWLSAVLKEDLGTVPETNYPILGGKLAIILWEMLETHQKSSDHFPDIKYNGMEIAPQDLSEEDKKKVDRFSLVCWLTGNAEYLSKLKPRSSHQISRHIDNHFTHEEATSLKKMLYPEKERSIAYQIFAIPLAYIPALTRFFISFVITTAAFFNGNPFPLAAVKASTKALAMKTKKDLTRLVVATTAFVYFLSKIASSFVKITVFPAMMLIGRLAGFLRFHPGHALHKAVATTHVLVNKIGEFFYPAIMTKGVVFANPIHTVKMTEKSYATLLRTLDINLEENIGRGEGVRIMDNPVFASPLQSNDDDLKNIFDSIPSRPKDTAFAS